MNPQNIYEGIDENYQTPPINKNREEQQYFSLVRELSPQEHILEQMAWISGEIWNSKLKRYEKVEGVKPFMNQDGRDIYFQYLTTILNPIITMSNYRADIKLIHNLMMMIIKDATIHFHLHWRDYGIKKKTQIKVITDKLLTVGLSSFYKALGGGDRKAATSNISENISTVSRNLMPQEQPQRRGFLSKMNPFSR